MPSPRTVSTLCGGSGEDSSRSRSLRSYRAWVAVFSACASIRVKTTSAAPSTAR